MSIFLFLFLAFLFYFIILPIIKGMMFVSKVRNQTRDMFNQATGRGSGKKQNNSQPQPKQKKIDPNVGEYVEFEEIEVTATDSSGNTTHVNYQKETQITDVEWEEIG
ncbi:MAG: hypothetical protein K2K27_02020 [Muribaculaceae bacterium]|nr:hypothetical protein [Muribaculaceae bacterium]